MLPNIGALQHHEGDRVSWAEIYKIIFVRRFLHKNREVSASKIRMDFSCMMKKAMQDAIHDQ